MNLRKNSANNTRTYFHYVLRQNWQHLIFYIILMLLTIVLPTVMNINDFNNREFSNELIRIDRAENISQTISGIILVISCAVAIFAGMSAFSYINSKQAVGCFHSFPITRQTIYLTETSVKSIYYLISLIFTVFLSYLMLEINLPLTASIRTAFFQVLLISVLSFCLFYSIVLFAAGLTGTGLLRFLIFGVISLLPIAIYFLICGSAYFGMPDTDMDAYMQFDILKWLCPIPFIGNIAYSIWDGQPHLLLNAALILLPAAVFYGIGYILHVKRKSEASGTSIIWKPVFVIIKYAVMFVCTLFGGVIFGSGLFTATEGGIWYIFGAVCGLILSFLLTNVILYRSVRSMFKGLRGLCVMAAAVALFIALSVYDVLGLNEYVYPANNTKSVSLILNTVEVEYTDEEDLEILLPMLSDYLERKNSPSNDSDKSATVILSNLNPVNHTTEDDMEKYMGNYLEEYYDEDGYSGYPEATAVEYVDVEWPSTKKVMNSTGGTADYIVRISTEWYQMKWKQTPKFGIPSYKCVNTPYDENNKELLEFILTSDEYAEAVSVVKNLPEDSVQEMTGNLFKTHFDFYFGDLYDPSTKEEFMELYREFKDVYNYSNESRMTSPAVGRVCIWDLDNRYVVPIYAEDIALINLFAEAINLDCRFNSVDEVYTYMAEEAAAVFLIDTETGDIISLPEEEQAEIFRYTAYAGYDSGFIPGETDGTKYAVIIAREYLYDNGFSDIDTCVCTVRPGAEDTVGRFFK